MWAAASVSAKLGRIVLKNLQNSSIFALFGQFCAGQLILHNILCLQNPRIIKKPVQEYDN